MESNKKNTIESNKKNTIKSNKKNTIKSNKKNTIESNKKNTIESNKKNTIEKVKYLIYNTYLNKKDYLNAYLHDFIFWIFFILFIIFITNLQDNYIIVKHFLIIITIITIIYKTYNEKQNNYADNFKEVILLIGFIIYLYKDTLTKCLNEKYMGYILILNVIVMCIPAFYSNNFHLGTVILLLALLSPLRFGIYNENYFSFYMFTYAFIFLIMYIFGHQFRYWSLLGLGTIIPMLINYNNKALLYRVVGILVVMLTYNQDIILFCSKYKYKIKGSFTNKKHGKHILESPLADLLFKYNNWKTSKIFGILIIIAYILLYKTFIFMKINNIRTIVT